jgi:hypothetical protein
VDREGRESLDEEIDGGGAVIASAARERGREGGRERRRRGGERGTAAAGVFIPSPGRRRSSPREINDLGVDTQELVVWRKTTEEEVGWAAGGLLPAALRGR